MKIIGLLLSFIFFATVAFADVCLMPPHESLIEKDQTVLAKHNSLLNNLRAADIQTNAPEVISLDKIKELQNMQDGLSLNSFDLKTDFNLLVVCVDFPDKKFSTPISVFDSLVFSDNQTTSNLAKFGSVKNYYLYNSYQRFNITEVILPSGIGFIETDSNYSYYVRNNYGLGAAPNTQTIFENVIKKIDPLVNFKLFDNDGNGYCDGVILFHPGSGAEYSGNTNDIWSHKWGINPKRYDDVWVSAFSIQPEFWSAVKPMTIGVIAHETGHLFGLPDLYDTDNSSRGIGKFSLMAGGSWNVSLGEKPAPIDAWCRKKLGNLFSEVVDVKNRRETVTLYPSENTPRIFRIPVSDEEYYLVENLQNEGLPVKGVAIWRCDETYHGANSNKNEWCPPDKMTNVNYQLALIQPNNLWELEKNIHSGRSGHLFNNAFNAFTLSGQPSSSFYNRDSSFIEVTNINLTNTPIVGTYIANINSCGCPLQGDINLDSNIDAFDISACVEVAWNNGTPSKLDDCKFYSEDVNCDFVIDIMDVIAMVNKVSRNKDFPKKFCE